MIKAVGITAQVIVWVLFVSAVSAWLFRPHPTKPYRWMRAVRFGTLVAVVATVLLVPTTLFQQIRHDVAQPTMPLVIGLSVIVSTALGTRWWPRPTGSMRTTTLLPRGEVATSAVPGRGKLAASSLVLAVLLIVSSVTADPGGSCIHRSWNGHVGFDNRYPGVGQVIPVGMLAVTVLLAAWWARREVEAQPGLPDDLQDMLYRARTATRILRGALFGVAGSAAWFAITMGEAVHFSTYQMYARSSSDPAFDQRLDWILVTGMATIGVGLVMAVLAGYAVVAHVTSHHVETALHRAPERPTTIGSLG